MKAPVRFESRFVSALVVLASVMFGVLLNAAGNVHAYI
jgi:hypothetical protein